MSDEEIFRMVPVSTMTPSGKVFAHKPTEVEAELRSKVSQLETDLQLARGLTSLILHDRDHTAFIRILRDNRSVRAKLNALVSAVRRGEGIEQAAAESEEALNEPSADAYATDHSMENLKKEIDRLRGSLELCANDPENAKQIAEKALG